MKNFRRQKNYGDYKVSHCPFCDKIATSKNEQGMNVCRLHTKEKVPEIRCTCGSWLETRSGKFGPYFNCVDCGNINYNKGLAMKQMTTPIKVEEPKTVKAFSEFSEYKVKKELKKEREEQKETIISSRDVEYFD